MVLIIMELLNFEKNKNIILVRMTNQNNNSNRDFKTCFQLNLNKNH